MKGVVQVLVVVAVLVVIAVGVFLLGSPDEERVLRRDVRRVTDLQNLSRAADLYWTRNGAVAASLDDLLKMPGDTSPTDPDTQQRYEYRPLDTKRYEVCATFEHASPRDRYAGDFWLHEAGRQCFEREAREVR